MEAAQTRRRSGPFTRLGQPITPIAATASTSRRRYCHAPDRHPETKYVGGPEELGWGVAAAAA